MEFEAPLRIDQSGRQDNTFLGALVIRDFQSKKRDFLMHLTQAQEQTRGYQTTTEAAIYPTDALQTASRGQNQHLPVCATTTSPATPAMAESDAVLDVTEPQDVEMATLDEGKPSAEEEAPYNPDRQAAVREFLDCEFALPCFPNARVLMLADHLVTEYLPSDIARSLNILRRMDETFENAKKQLEEHTLAVANASNGSSGSSIPRSNGLPPLSNGLCAPTPDSPVVTSGKIVLPCDRAMALRVSIAQSLKRCRMARMQSKVESERLSLNVSQAPGQRDRTNMLTRNS